MRALRMRIHPAAAVMAVGMTLVALWTAVKTGERWETGGLTAVAVAAILHEMGHVAAAWGWSVPIRAMRLDLFGARLELGGLTGYTAELAVAAGGPLASLVCFALLRPWGAESGWTGLLGTASLGLGLVNLLPVRGLDGGRMLACALSLAAGDRAADATLRVTTGLALGGLWLLSVYALLRAGETLSLFVFSLCLLLRLQAT